MRDDGYTRAEIISIIRDALALVCPHADRVDPDTCLLGSGAILDSVAFVTLLVSLEQSLGNRVDLSASFMEQGNVDDKQNCFRTVGSLADHVHGLLSEQAQGLVPRR